MKCSWCQATIIRNLTIQEIVWPFVSNLERCTRCNQQLESIDPHSCPTCKKAGHQTKCPECEAWQKIYPSYEFSHDAFFKYNPAFKEWIQQYKFQGDYQLKETFVPELTRYFRFKKQALVVPIPIDEKKFQARGFNQVESFLVAANINVTKLLEKKEESMAQVEKNRKERLAMTQPFSLSHLDCNVKGKVVILVDDVYTTGRTLFHAAELLLTLKPQKILTLSLAR